MGGTRRLVGLIWAQARDAAGRPVIGSDGTIPWRVPEDLALFRSVTQGHPVIMGRRTWESLPRSVRPLPGRTNIVVTRQRGWVPELATEEYLEPDSERGSVIVGHSLDEALALAGAAPGSAETWVIGGGQLYAEALPRADRCVVTQIDRVVEGDTYAPEVADGWTVVADDHRMSRAGIAFRVRRLERIGA